MGIRVLSRLSLNVYMVEGLGREIVDKGSLQIGMRPTPDARRVVVATVRPLTRCGRCSGRLHQEQLWPWRPIDQHSV